MRPRFQVLTVMFVAGCVGLALAADQTILGKAFSVKDPKPGVDAAKRKVTATGFEKNSATTLVGDPTLLSPAGGGVLEVYVYGGVDLSQTFVLAQGTSSKGKPFWRATNGGFAYSDPAGNQGPVTAVAITRTSSGKVSVKATILGKYGPVDILPPNPGASGCVALQLGVDAGYGDRYSVQFGPDSAIKNAGPKSFGAKKPTQEGICVAPTTTTTTTTSSTTTTLPDPCITGNGGCDPLTSCLNDAGSAICGPCPSGYDGTGNTACTDVNECAIDNGGCSTSPAVTCTNLPGDSDCGPCPSGYTGSGITCNDVNECATNNGGCSASPPVTCTNVPGARTCGPCPSGYTGSGITCNDVNECATNNGGCSASPPVTCTNVPGARTCGPCPSGYTGSGITCTDVNECATNNGGCVGPTPVCVNETGGFGCN